PTTNAGEWVDFFLEQKWGSWTMSAFSFLVNGGGAISIDHICGWARILSSSTFANSKKLYSTRSGRPEGAGRRVKQDRHGRSRSHSRFRSFWQRWSVTRFPVNYGIRVWITKSKQSESC